MSSGNGSNSDKRTLSEFGLVTGAMLALMFGALIPWIWAIRPWPLWPWVCGGVLIVLGIVWPTVLRGPYTLWMKLAALLGWVNSRLLLAATFFLMILPIALVMRLLGKVPLTKGSYGRVSSYRIDSRTRHRDELENPF